MPFGYATIVESKRHDVTFLVRMWLTEGPPEGRQWRGSIQEVASGRRLFVTGTRDIADFIDAHLAEAPARKP
jgi:hypothetical protein